MLTRKRKLVESADDVLKKTKKESESEFSKPKEIVKFSSIVNDKRLSFEFYNKPCLELSKNLLGKILVRRFDDNIYVRTRIVEVEAYLGDKDQASHSFDNNCTDRTKAMFMPPGTVYVYNIYGIYCCLNISAKEDGAAVLIRAVEVINEIELLGKNRDLSAKKSINIKKDLTNGPSKLCQALNITKILFDQKSFCTDEYLWLEKDESEEKVGIVASKRINIDSAGEEACSKLYRFYIKDNQFVSKIDKNAVELN